MELKDELNALYKEFPKIKDELYWKTWESMYQCRYDDPVFMKLYDKMCYGEITYDVDHLPDNLKKFWFELNADLAKVEYYSLKSRAKYVEPHDKETKQYYSDLNNHFTHRERLEDAEYCAKGGDIEILQDIEDSVEESLKVLRDSMDEKKKQEMLDYLRNI
jgi:hypothetical protein